MTAPAPQGPLPPAALLLRGRQRLVYALSALMIALYFGFMALFAFDKPLLGRTLAPGLTLCLVLGPAVILTSCIVSLAYVLWANLVFDPAVARLAERVRPAGLEVNHGQ